MNEETSLFFDDKAFRKVTQAEFNAFSETESDAYEDARRRISMAAIAANTEQQNEIDDLRARLTLSHYVGQTVALAPARCANGRPIPHERHGTCPEPTHPDDTTKSFYVNDRKGIYHCFGCGIHGDIIRFIHTYHGKSHPETMAFVHEEAKRMTMQQDIILNEADKALAQGREIAVLDPWTTREVPHRSSRGTRRTRGLRTRPGYSPALSVSSAS